MIKKTTAQKNIVLHEIEQTHVFNKLIQRRIKEKNDADIYKKILINTVNNNIRIKPVGYFKIKLL